MSWFTELFGGDDARDHEAFFLTLMLEIGTPKPLDLLYVRHHGKRKVNSIIEPDVMFVLRFAELARKCGVTCDGNKQFVSLYQAYERWYARQQPDQAVVQ